MSNVISLPGVRDLPKSKKSSASRMDTMLLTPQGVRQWKLPPFQRPLRVNEKVRALSEELKQNGGIIPGVLTLGEIGKETFLIDGQHRVEAFALSELKEGIADVRICRFDDLADMGEEFVQLNSSIVKMRPDDVLRGLEGVIRPLSEIRRRCEFIGYDMIRRGARGPMVSMSAALRCWFGSASEVPGSAGTSAMMLARDMTEEDAMHLIQYFNLIHGAWGHDQEYWRLWGGLNLTVLAWLWRRTVLAQYSQKSVRLTVQAFGECAMGLSADGHYLSWLSGRNLTDRDRSPCYNRIKTIFGARIKEKTGKLALFPAPPWSHGGGGKLGKPKSTRSTT